MGVWLGPRGLPKHKKPPVFTYTGQYELFTDTRADGTVDWELVLKTSGILTFSRVVDKVDLFLVGGGKPGTSGAYSGSWSTGYARGGAGGTGGERVTQTNVDVQAGVAYAITVGDSNEATSALGSTARSGYGSSGGTGAYENASSMARDAATAATVGATSFSVLWNTSWLFGAGGGGGAAKAGNLGGSASSSGAATGGGSGGTSSHRGGYDGAANTGSGGGGGYAVNTQSDVDYGTGGAGGSGVVIIRNAR